MIKSVVEILEEVESRGELEQGTTAIRVKNQFDNRFQGLSVEAYKDFDAFCFCNRLYVYYDGGWYEGTNHPASPFPEWKDSKPGYHLTKIDKHRYGTIDKIQEELDELVDANRQCSKVMMLVELADLYGAIEGYLQERFPGMEMHDLKKFSDITKRAFKNGHRS